MWYELQVDRAVRTWGIWIQNKVEERDDYGNKVYQSVADILLRFDPKTGLPGPLDPKEWARGTLGQRDLMALGKALQQKTQAG